MASPRDPDSGKGKILATPADRDRAAAAAIKRDLDDALARERPEIEAPRTRTPADRELAAAIDELRRGDGQWHAAEQIARAADALAAKGREIEARVADLEKLRERIAATIRRIRAWIVGAIVTSATSAGAVVYGAGVKAGHAHDVRAAAAEQTRVVRLHHAWLTRDLPLALRDTEHRVDEHDRALRLDTRPQHPIRFPPPGDQP